MSLENSMIKCSCKSSCKSFRFRTIKWALVICIKNGNYGPWYILVDDDSGVHCINTYESKKDFTKLHISLYLKNFISRSI